MLRKGGLAPGYVDGISYIACLLAAIIHDFEHVGRTNDFLSAYPAWTHVATGR